MGAEIVHEFSPSRRYTGRRSRAGPRVLSLKSIVLRTLNPLIRRTEAGLLPGAIEQYARRAIARRRRDYKCNPPPTVGSLRAEWSAPVGLPSCPRRVSAL